MPTQHDSAFKRMFVHPELVRALLELVPNCPACAAEGLDRLNCSFVSSSELQRTADMVWRVYGRDFLFYLLLEFQSTIDPQMAQRIHVYTGLLSQEIFAQHKLSELLNLLPVVVYSGCRRWRRTQTSGPDWLKPLQSGEVFFLIDEEIAGNSIIGDVIRLARGTSLAEMIRSQEALLAWPMASEELRKDVLQIASERLAKFGVKQEVIMSETVEKNTRLKLSERDRALVHQFIRSTYLVWKDDPRVQLIVKELAEARRKGEADGRQEGLQEGLQVGRQQGRQQGRQEGRQEGRTEALRAALGKACQCNALGKTAKLRLANANCNELESWLDRLIAGEKLNNILEEDCP